MTNSANKSPETTITVPANPDLDDCLTGAAEAYIAKHPALRGYDLAPRWADETRESVTLTLPRFPIPSKRIANLFKPGKRG